MEKMPYQPELDTRVVPVPAGQTIGSDWQQRLPVLCGKQVVLRELRTSDAASLFALLTTEEVSRFISPPPATSATPSRFRDSIPPSAFSSCASTIRLSPRRNGALPSARRSGAPACS